MAPAPLTAQLLFGETDQLLAWIVMALGGALAVGTTMALLRPREAPRPRASSSARPSPAAS